MSYKQIPGSVQMFVNEKGTFRIGLRNLYPDDNRLLYKRDKENNLIDEWPDVVVRTEDESDPLVMSVPEAILKAQGVIPSSVECDSGDFEIKKGAKYKPANWGQDNIEYTGAKKTPYKGKPKEVEPEPEPKQPTEPPKKAEEQTESKEPAEVKIKENPLSKGSAELSAKEAVEIIETYDYEELEDIGFYTEDTLSRPRKTVQDAWTQKGKTKETP